MTALALSGIAAAGDSDMIRISAQIHSVNRDGSSTVIAEPTLAVPVGKWAAFKDLNEYTFPIKYTLPSIPAELAKTAKIARNPNDTEAWTTNQQGAVIPEHPAKFESREQGLTAKFRPRINSNGKVVVECEVEQTVFHGFVNETNPITVTKVRKGGKKTTETILQNARQRHVFTTRRQELKFLPTETGHIADILSDEVTEEAENAKAPKILVSLSAERLEKPEEKRKAPPKNARVFVTVQVIEMTGAPVLDPATAKAVGMNSPILTDSQFQVMIRALNQKKGVDLLSAPSLLLPVGKTGKVEVTREFIYPVEYDPPEIPSEVVSANGPAKDEKGMHSFPVTPAAPTEFKTVNTGVEIEVAARILSDRRIELDLRPAVIELEGMLNFGTAITIDDISAFGKKRKVVLTENRIEMPKFHRREIETTARLNDGLTVILGGLVKEEIQDVEDKIPVLGDLPFVGRLARSRTELHLKRHLLFAIKAELVDEGE
ncbi:MAG: hypothetical protein P1U86_22585 [Verrucomicrobiales bacterium]|nr:hypothetical protein [Verrucomicrobiales bacterium]